MINVSPGGGSEQIAVKLLCVLDKQRKQDAAQAHEL